jgi:hypothetical protein
MEEEDLDYELTEDEELMEEAAIACAIDLSKQYGLSKWVDLEEAIQLSQ